MSTTDIVTNIVSDFAFVGIIALLYWLIYAAIYRKRLTQALGFFNFDQDAPTRIFVSGFEHQGVKTKRVVNALELESALLLKDELTHPPRSGLLPKLASLLAQLIGQSLSYPEPIIEPAPLERASGPVSHRSVILIGGPVANALSDYYLQTSSPSFKFNPASSRYQAREGAQYTDVPTSDNLAVIEKLVYEDQVVILLHGIGEEQTVRAVRHLKEHWRHLWSMHDRRAFAISV